MSRQSYQQYRDRHIEARRPESGIPYFTITHTHTLNLSQPDGPQLALHGGGPKGTPVIHLVDGKDSHLTMDQLELLREAALREAAQFDQFAIELNSFPDIREALGITQKI